MARLHTAIKLDIFKTGKEVQKERMNPLDYSRLESCDADFSVKTDKNVTRTKKLHNSNCHPQEKNTSYENIFRMSQIKRI